MDQKALAALLFPDVTETPEDLEARYPARDLPEVADFCREFLPSYGMTLDELLGRRAQG